MKGSCIESKCEVDSRWKITCYIKVRLLDINGDLNQVMCSMFFFNWLFESSGMEHLITDDLNQMMILLHIKKKKKGIRESNPINAGE